MQTVPIVIDTGSYQTKIGFSGDYEPKCIIDTCVAVDQPPSSINSQSSNGKCYLIDDQLHQKKYHSQAYNFSIVRPFTEYKVSNMDALSAIWKYGLYNKLRLTEDQLHDSSFLMSEPPFWSSTYAYNAQFMKYRVFYAQTLFEEFNCHSMYLAKDAMLAAFAHGKKSAMVLDLGHSCTKCTPIENGFVLNHGLRITKCGAQMFDNILLKKWQSLNISDDKKEEQKSDFYHSFSETSMIRDLRESMCGIRGTQFSVANLPFSYMNYETNDTMKRFMVAQSIQNLEFDFRVVDNKANVNSVKDMNNSQISLENNSKPEKKRRQYELPDGRIILDDEWQFSIPEMLFADYCPLLSKDFEDECLEVEMQSDSCSPKSELFNSNTRRIWNEKNYKTFKFSGLANMMMTSINNCDVEIRQKLMNNIVICGGHSRYRGFIERFSTDLTRILPFAYNPKMYYGKKPYERSISVFRGGSLLSSLSLFQERWMTKKMYEEHGPNIIHRHCP